jgi:hydrogenase maturation protease
MGRVVVIGVGNLDRGDDGAGVAAARMVRGAEVRLANGLELLDAWEGFDAVVVIDAAQSMGAPGRVHRLDGLSDELPPALSQASTHGFGVAEAVAMGRALGRLPGRLVVYAIEAADFSPGAGLSSAVAAALPGLVAQDEGELADA